VNGRLALVTSLALAAALAAACSSGRDSLGGTDRGNAPERMRYKPSFRDLAAHASTSGAVRSFTARADGTAVFHARLVGGEPEPPNGFGDLVLDVSRVAALRRPWGDRTRVSVELRVARAFTGDFGRAHRARLFLEDARGRRLMLPNALIVDRPAATNGWIRLEGRPTTRIPIPLGHTDPGFDARRVVAIGVNVEAGRRDGVVADGDIELRSLEVTFHPPIEPRILPSDPAIVAGEGERARRMQARWNARLGDRARDLIAGVNLPYPGPLGPDGNAMQLYGTFLEAREAWHGESWDLSNEAVRASLRADLARIRETFGERAIVRVCLFGDLRSGVELDARGVPVRVTERALAATRTLFDIAAEERVLLVPMWLDFLIADGVTHQGPNGAWRVGEHPELVVDPAKRARLLGAFEAYTRALAGHPSVLAWEVMNEPENALAVVTPEHFADLQAFLRDGVDAIHRAGELATVGHRNPLDAARFARGRIASDLGQAHFYPRLETRSAPFDLGAPPGRAFGSIPSGWGESPARPGRIAADLERARHAGHRFLMFWSWRSDDSTGDGLRVRAYSDEIRRALETRR